MMQDHRAAQERISQLLDEIVDIMKPDQDTACCDEHTVPDGPWMINHWALAVDFITDGEMDSVDNWTVVLRSKNCPRTQCLGLGHTIVNFSGG